MDVNMIIRIGIYKGNTNGCPDKKRKGFIPLQS